MKIVRRLIASIKLIQSRFLLLHDLALPERYLQQVGECAHTRATANGVTCFFYDGIEQIWMERHARPSHLVSGLIKYFQ